jgi:hypothetical protein
MTAPSDEAPVVDQPEVHQPHAHHRGGLPRWLELLIALTALVTSISSIAIAVHHGHIMEKLVLANSIPYLQSGFSDSTPEGERILSLDFFNRGVGPAHQKSLRVKVDGRYVKNAQELYAASLGPELAAQAATAFVTTKNQVPRRFIPGGAQQFVFMLRKTPENAEYWEQLRAARARWNLEFCYCSVFEECWNVPGIGQNSQRVESCTRDESVEFVP